MDMMPLAEWQKGGEFFEHQGLRIFTRTAGKGPALLLIHGFPTASWDWSPLWDPLHRRFRTLTLDLIGYGFSDKPEDHDYLIASQADLCEAFLERQGVTEYHILAHDYGDTVAQELLARHLKRKAKQKLLSVCFLNGGLFPEMHRARLVQKLLLTPLGSWVARRMTKEKLARSLNAILGEAKLNDVEIDGFWTLLTHNDGRKVVPKLIRYIPQRRDNRDRWVGALENSNIPLRLINGADDPVSGAHVVRHYRKLVPRADSVLLRGVGHYPQVEAPDAVLRYFLEFHDMLPSTLFAILEDAKVKVRSA
jgi:pimeloyl-ACP methyl ester carboxylesterase